jgi:O-antigen/teichoic acid export membrane protein
MRHEWTKSLWSFSAIRRILSSDVSFSHPEESVRMRSWAIEKSTKLMRTLGMDRAIAYTSLARIFSIAGSVGTVLLIVHFLNVVEQGYYYSLLSLVRLQIIFELGFSFVIQQFAAHESAKLKLHQDGRIEGDPLAHARLALVLKKTLQWYLVAGVLLGVTLVPAGLAYFSHRSDPAVQVAWHWPMYVSVFTCVVIFILDPLLSFLDGCGYVKQVAGLRMAQAIVGIGTAWSAFFVHEGLYSPAMVILGNVVAALFFLWKYRRLLGGLLRFRAEKSAIAWRTEVWSFQWRIAISWLCSYLMVQLFVPALFLLRSPAEAGQMGMSLSIGGYMWQVVLSWTSTKATPFGQMIARREFATLDRQFGRTLRQSLLILVVLLALCMVAIIAIQRFFPTFAHRMISPWDFILLFLAVIGMFIVQCQAIYLRAHKREPFLWQSLGTALLTCLGIALLVPRLGTFGAASAYAFSATIVALPWATIIFYKMRKERDRIPPAILVESASSNGAFGRVDEI